MDDHLVRGFVQRDSLGFEPLPGASQIRLSGHIACRGRIAISVVKHIDIIGDGDAIDDNPRVVTCKYAYQAFVAGHGGFLRHDNSHPHDGHGDSHHYHEGDWATGAESDPVWCGVNGWPNLSEFINKVGRWYDEHCDELPDPEGAVSEEELAVYDERTKLFDV